MSAPYYTSPYGSASLYLGDCREVLPALGFTADLIVADPPYGETSLSWDRWPDGWPSVVAAATSSLWCFGTLRMALNVAHEFNDWRLSQDVIWEKHNGSGPGADRFRRVHEHVLHWYRGRWDSTYHVTPRVARTGKNQGTRRARSVGGHRGQYADCEPWVDDGTRLMRSVIKVPSMKGRAIHPSEKPVDLLAPLIEYACPPGGLVIDPFAGSGATLDAARQSGRRAIGIERHEPYAEKAAQRLERLTLEAS